MYSHLSSMTIKIENISHHPRKFCVPRGGELSSPEPHPADALPVRVFPVRKHSHMLVPFCVCCSCSVNASAMGVCWAHASQVLVVFPEAQTCHDCVPVHLLINTGMASVPGHVPGVFLAPEPQHVPRSTSSYSLGSTHVSVFQGKGAQHVSGQHQRPGQEEGVPPSDSRVLYPTFSLFCCTHAAVPLPT